ncbi:MAG: universal stress protein [Actinomycetota bacterium]|nr:universal stress protein [Actinomycetota bacterium]
MPGPRSIMVAVDLPASANQLASVAELATACGWPVRLVHVAAPASAFIGFDEPGGAYDEEARAAKIQRESDELEAMAESLREMGVTTGAAVLTGPTVEVLVKEAEQHNAAMIVLTDYRHRTAHRVVFGSVASSLLKVAPVPVLVVPQGEGTTDPGLSAAVERLLDVIERQEPTPELTALKIQAEEQLGSGPEPGKGWMRDGIHHFETDHPSLIRALCDVGYYLSGTGI